MNERRAFILDMVAEAYIDSVKPVASAFIADRLNVSSATVRNEFSFLEDQGYLKQPHTAAGRKPTMLGYETYASKLIPPEHLSEAQLGFLKQFLQNSHGDRFLQGVADVSSKLSGYAVVVCLPADENLKALEIHLSGVSSTHLLAVLVLENGLIRQLSVEFDELPKEDILKEAELNLRQLALPIKELPTGLLSLARRVEQDLSETLLALAAALPNLTPPKLFSQGLHQVLSEPEANDPEFMRRLVTRFENPEQNIGEDDLTVGLDESVASITARLPFGSSQAKLMLLGPTRMRYRDALKVAHGVSQNVSAFALN